MVTKEKIGIGLLLLILISTGAIYIEWKDDARIRIDNDKSTFYVPHESYDWMWVVAGREYNQLYDGTSKMKRDLSEIKVDTFYDDERVIIVRTTPYIRGPVIVDTYLMDGTIDDIEQFPISHTVQILNGKGYYYRYEVKDLKYDGDTFKLDGTQTHQDFGRNMKVDWWNNYRLGWVYKSGSMYVKSEKLPSDNEVFNVRLFDPVKYGSNLSLFLNGINSDRNYEYYTGMNVTATITSCTGDCTICVDIDDNINNLTQVLGDKNYSCGDTSVSFIYNITTLRENKFSDGNTEYVLASSGEANITMNDLTDLVQFKLNITNSGGGSDNVSIDLDDDGIDDVILIGTLINNELITDSFYLDDVKYSIVNTTRSSEGTKTIYMNITTESFEDFNPVNNFSFRIDGFNIDDGNDLNYTQSFLDPTVDDGTAGAEVSILSNIEDYENNDSSNWFNDTHDYGGNPSILSLGSNAYLNLPFSYSCTGCPGTLSINKFYYENIPNFDLRQGNYFSTRWHESGSISATANSKPSGTKTIYLTDGTQSVHLWSKGLSETGGGEGNSFSLWINLTGNMTDDDTLDLYLGDTYSKTVSLSSLDDSIKPYFKIYISYGWPSGSGNSNSFSMTTKIYNISVGGISLAMENSNYTTGGGYNYTSPSLKEADNNIYRATFTVNDLYNPFNTSLTYYLSNDDATTWEEVTNATSHTFSSSGDNISARFEVFTNDTTISPIVYDYSVDIIPSAVSEIYVDVGSDGTNDWYYDDILNSTTSPQYVTTNGSSLTDYVNSTSCTGLTCFVPIAITFGSAGQLQISEYNLTLNPFPLTLDTDAVEDENPVTLDVTFTSGSITLSDLMLDFLGSKNITVFAHFWNDTSFNTSWLSRVKYSKFNLSLPENVSYWDVFANTKDDKNLTPYGQSNTTAIWTVDSLAYEDPFDLEIRVNESLDNCLNITWSNDTTKDGGTIISTTHQEVCNDVAVDGSCSLWNWVDLENCTSRYEIPWFDFSAICKDCVRTEDYWLTNIITG